MADKSLEALLREGKLTSPGAVQLALGVRELLGFDDTIEDTDTAFEELEQHFGSAIAGIVREVMDDKALPKQERKLLQIEDAAHASQ
jgi:guanosine-3',5'-bis(diphosphate) 3'-pyrophosphohydrolase